MQTTGTTGHGDAPRAPPPDRPHLVSLRTVLAFQTTKGRLRLLLAVARAWRGIPDRAADPIAAAAEQDARDAPIRPGTRYRRLRRRPAPDLLPFPTRLMPPAAWDQEIGDTARARPTGALQCSLRLATGQYRSAAVGSGYHDSSQGAGSSWSVQLMAAPEPESVLLLATVVGVGLVAGRRQRRNGQPGAPDRCCHAALWPATPVPPPAASPIVQANAPSGFPGSSASASQPLGRPASTLPPGPIPEHRPDCRSCRPSSQAPSAPGSAASPAKRAGTASG